MKEEPKHSGILWAGGKLKGAPRQVKYRYRRTEERVKGKKPQQKEMGRKAVNR